MYLGLGIMVACTSTHNTLYAHADFRIAYPLIPTPLTYLEELAEAPYTCAQEP